MPETITKLIFREVVVPLERETGFSTRTLRERAYLVVEVHSGGKVGYGYCYAGHSGAAALSAIGSTTLAPAVLGADPLDTTRIWLAMRAAGLLLGRDGAMMRVVSAIDIALWDLKGKLLGIPLHKLVGGIRTSVPVYASGGYYMPTSTADDIKREVAGYREGGFVAAKIKVGRESVQGDKARIAAARKELGEDGPLMLDANNAWVTVIEAERAVNEWAACRPYWIEEPFGPDQLDSHVRLAERISIPVTTGELQAGIERFYAYMQNGKMPIIQPDAAVCGGITAFLRLLPIAEATGTSVCPHWFHEIHAPLAAASNVVTWIECFPDASVFNFSKLLSRSLPVKNGVIHLDDTPGNGVVLDPKALESFQKGHVELAA